MLRVIEMLLMQQQVVEKMMSARTPTEIETARELRDEWLRNHPNDLIVLDAGEFVENMAESFGLSKKATASRMISRHDAEHSV